MSRAIKSQALEVLRRAQKNGGVIYCPEKGFLASGFAVVATPVTYGSLTLGNVEKFLVAHREECAATSTLYIGLWPRRSDDNWLYYLVTVVSAT